MEVNKEEAVRCRDLGAEAWAVVHIEPAHVVDVSGFVVANGSRQVEKDGVATIADYSKPLSAVIVCADTKME